MLRLLKFPPGADFDNPFVTELIGLAVGLIFIIIGFKKRSQWQSLHQNGIKAEGVVIGLEDSDPTVTDSLKYPVIKFLTLDKEWITAKYTVASKPGYVEGDRVNVIYDATDNKNFILDDKLSQYTGNVFIAAGAGMLFFLLYVTLFN